jgi:hypothetical protein
MKNGKMIALSVGGSLLLGACASTGEGEVEIPISEVPPAVMSAAQDSVDGLQVSEAEVEWEEGVQNYELEGTANGKEYEIDISPAGKVLSVEEEEQD